MKIDILTLFPEMFEPLKSSIIGKAVENKFIEIDTINIRSFSKDKHNKVDDTIYGGGAGMLIRPDVVYDAYLSVKSKKAKVIYLSPQGKTLNQEIVKNLSQDKHLILLCGHYEGIDERVLEEIVDEEISIGDYVLTGGEIPAMVLIDSVTRYVDGVLNADSVKEESFSDGMLEYPQYTRPEVFLDKKVPEVLLSRTSQKHRRVAKTKIRRNYKKEKTRFKKINVGADSISAQGNRFSLILRKERKKMDIIKAIEHEQMKSKIPVLNIGDTVKVHVRVKEGNRERIQIFEGIIIKVQGGGVNQTFTARRISYGVGVEKTFLIHSPTVEKVEVVRVGKARRAKLFYLRDRIGKSAKTKEKIGARIETKEITIKADYVPGSDDVVEEPTAEEIAAAAVEIKAAEAAEEAAKAETANVETNDTATAVDNNNNDKTNNVGGGALGDSKAIAEDPKVESAPEEAPAVETEAPVVEEVVDTVSEEPVEVVKDEPEEVEENKE